MESVINLWRFSPSLKNAPLHLNGLVLDCSPSKLALEDYFCIRIRCAAACAQDHFILLGNGVACHKLQFGEQV